MFRKAFWAAAICACCTTSLLADFTYEQSSKITGGMMAGMMKFAGAFSKQAREPMRSTVIVKGDRMAMVNGDRINVIDLDKETFTDIDTKNKTYAVITFADMMRAMAKASEKMKSNEADFTFSADVKNTGASRVVNGMDAKQIILTLTMEGTDKKSGNKMNMLVTSDMWMAPSMSGYEEVRNFYTKMAQKMAWSPNSGFLGALSAQQPGMSKGMAEVSKEMAKMDGVPVLQVLRMNGAGTGMPSEADMAAAQQQGAQQQQQPPPTAGDAAGTAATGAALGRSGKIGALAGGLGGFGGFGRKKKQQQAEEQAAPQQQAAAPAPQAAPAGGSTPPGTLMEVTTELTSFSSGAADASKFEVPAGFKQVDHGMQKALR
jgi:hypothetical protein